MKTSLTLRGILCLFAALVASAHAQTIYNSYAISTLKATNNGALFFNTPYDVAAGSDGNLYVAATYDYTIWKLTRNTNNTWNASILAGSPGASGSTDGLGTAARFTYPQCVATDTNGNVYVGDSFNHLIRKITPDGNVTTIGSGPNVGYVTGLTVAPSGTIYFCDPNGLGTVGSGGAGRSSSASYYNGGIAVNTNGDIFSSDQLRHTIRKGSTIIAGTDGVTGSTDGVGSAALFNTPDDIALDGAGNIYVADTGNNLLRKISFDGTNWNVRTMAGVPGAQGSVNGSADAARFGWPTGITVDSAGIVYTAEVKNYLIRAAVFDGPTNTANIWTNTVNGKWEDGTSWSIGYPTIEDEFDYITNAATKAVLIDANTVATRPDSLTINNLLVAAPDNTINGLVLYNSGFSKPLRIKEQLAIDYGGVISITNGNLRVDLGLSVGYDSGNAALNIFDGGFVTSTASYIGYQSDSSAGHVSGLNAFWTNKTFLTIGAQGDNNGLLIENGGAIGSQTASIGKNGNNNAAVVTGIGSFWRNPGRFALGDTGGSGNSLTILNGASVYLGNAGLEIGGGGDANVVTISEPGSVLSTPGPILLTHPTQSTYNALFIGNSSTVTTSSLVVSNGNFVGIAGGRLNTASTLINNGVVFPLGTGEQNVTLHLNGGVHTFMNGLEVTDHAVVNGCGVINGPVTIDVGGTIQCDSGCAIIFNGPVTNNGTILPLDGTNVTFAGGLVNAGTVLTFSPPPPSPCLTITNGQIVNHADSSTYNITDGTNTVQFNWSSASPGHSGYFYATYTTDIALATSITNIDQVTNASTFSFKTNPFDYLGPVNDGDTTGIGQFTVLRNRSSQNYAVVRWDDVHNDGSISATWWFQSKPGVTNFNCGTPPVISVPVAVTNLVAHASPGNLGLNFLTQPQRAYTIQVRTNLTSGPWRSFTNFLGDGTSHDITLPVGSPQGFYRVLTQ